MSVRLISWSQGVAPIAILSAAVLTAAPTSAQTFVGIPEATAVQYDLAEVTEAYRRRAGHVLARVPGIEAVYLRMLQFRENGKFNIGAIVVVAAGDEERVAEALRTTDPSIFGDLGPTPAFVAAAAAASAYVADAAPLELPASPPDEPAAPRVQPPSEEEIASWDAALRAAETTGALIFELDRAAWVATDEATSHRAFRRDDRSRGWITERRGEQIAVLWIVETSPDEYSVGYEVLTEGGEVVRRSYEAFDEPQLLSPTQAASFAARNIALAALTDACAGSYNSVVYEDDEVAGATHRVYLLPGQTEEDELRFGGNFRFDVSVDEGAVLAQRAFTNTCISLTNEPPAVALTVTHLLDPHPTEIHVFLNLLAGKPVYIGTSRNGLIWAIVGGEIRLIRR